MLTTPLGTRASCPRKSSALPQSQKPREQAWEGGHPAPWERGHPALAKVAHSVTQENRGNNPGNEGILPSARLYPPSLRRVAFKIRSTK